MEHLNQSFHISQLIIKSFHQKLNGAEKAELEEWLANHPKNRELYNTLNQKNLETKKQQIQQLHPQKGWEHLEKKIPFPKRFRYVSLFKYAAILLIILSAGALFYTRWQAGNTPSQTAIATIIPGSAKPILILESGEKVELTNGQNFYLQQDSNIQLANNNNILKVQIFDTLSSLAESYSTLSVPKGGEYQLALSDGSKIWLNSDSRLRFPSRFTGDTRTVFLEEGEAYFEITHNSEKPFIVSSRDMNIQVLGTKFNIKAYSEDKITYTTLVSGSVRTNSKQTKDSVVLHPNEQCIYNSTNRQMEICKVDPQVSIGWVQGRFIFENETLQEILKQLSRWYDVDVIYQNQEVTKYRFTGNVDRFAEISTLLQMIEKTYNISFNTEGGTVMVNGK